MKYVDIDNRSVGRDFPTYVIAEVGINHNGDVGLAKEMISAAWESGADAVKIQTFITEDFLHPSHPGYQYDIDAQITQEQENELWEHARKKQINLFSTPEEFKSLNFIKTQNPHLIKIAAMDFNYKDLIQKAAALKKPILLSSGMSTLEEVLRTIRWVEEAGNRDYIVLHCVSCYPTQPQACNLAAMQTLQKVLNCPVGFSDHTEGIHIALAAVAMGADVIEKHFTIDKQLPGPDQKASMNPAELRSLVTQIRDIEKAFGSGCKQPAPEEKEPRRFKRRGVYAIADLPAGTALNMEQVEFFAPSKEGCQVTDWPLMSGNRLKHSVKKMEPIYLDDLDL